MRERPAGRPGSALHPPSPTLPRKGGGGARRAARADTAELALATPPAPPPPLRGRVGEGGYAPDEAGR